MTDLLLSGWMFLGVALPLLFAATQALAPRPASPALAGLCLVLALIQLGWLAQWAGLAAAAPALVFLTQPLLFLVGPLGWLHARGLRSLPFTPRLLWHFLPAVGVLGYSLYAFGAWAPGAPLRQPWWLVALSGSGALYMLAVFRPIARLALPGRRRAERWLVLAFALVGVGVGGAALLGGMLGLRGLEGAYLALMPLLLIALFLLEARHPALLAAVSEAVEEEAQQRYRRSSLTHVDVEQAVARLTALMARDRLYAREELTLPLLAEASGLSAHQLSELLNERLGQSFSAFLKAHRVAEARRLLLAEPDTPVLDVGLAVGFSSSSAFYAAFRELTGQAPGQFRREHAAATPAG